MQVEGGIVDGQLAGLKARQVQQIGQQPVEMVPAFGNRAREALRFAAIHAVLKQVGHAENAGQGRADFMADKGQEARLFLIEGPGVVLCLLQAFLGDLHRAGAGRILHRHRREQRRRADQAEIFALRQDDHAIVQGRGRAVRRELCDQAHRGAGLAHDGLVAHQVCDAGGAIGLTAAGRGQRFDDGAARDHAERGAITDDGHGELVRIGQQSCKHRRDGHSCWNRPHGDRNVFYAYRHGGGGVLTQVKKPPCFINLYAPQTHS